jgi:hypothetical protein
MQQLHGNEDAASSMPYDVELGRGLGDAVNSVLAIGGVGGLAIGLAGREILENLFTGLIILSSSPFEVGEEVLFTPPTGPVTTCCTPPLSSPPLGGTIQKLHLVPMIMASKPRGHMPHMHHATPKLRVSFAFGGRSRFSCCPCSRWDSVGFSEGFSDRLSS